MLRQCEHRTVTSFHEGRHAADGVVDALFLADVADILPIPEREPSVNSSRAMKFHGKTVPLKLAAVGIDNRAFPAAYPVTEACRLRYLEGSRTGRRHCPHCER